MEIRDVGNVGRVNNDSKINKTSARKDTDSKAPIDNVQISDEAKIKAEMSKVQGMVDNAPDIRKERVEEVKAKLESGAYDNEEVMNKVAERLMKVLGF